MNGCELLQCSRPSKAKHRPFAPSERLRANARERIRGRIFAGEFERFAEQDAVQRHRIFINTIPVIIGAGTEFIPQLKPHIQPHSTEAEHFLWHFENVEQADFSRPEYLELSSKVFG